LRLFGSHGAVRPWSRSVRCKTHCNPKGQDVRAPSAARSVARNAATSPLELRRRPSSCDVAPRTARSPLELRARRCSGGFGPPGFIPSARCRKVRPRQRVLAVPHWLPRPMRGAARIGALELGPAVHPGTEGCMASARVLIPCPRCRELGPPTGRDEQRTLAGQATAVVQMGCELADASREAGRVRAAAQPTRKASSPSRSSCVSGA
jgi:hypothetical protein